MDGIQAGRDELLKMTERILIRGPISFLILCHHEHGPGFCRAPIADQDLIENTIDARSVVWRRGNAFGFVIQERI